MFPEIQNKQQLTTVIDGRTEFIDIDKDWYSVIDYVVRMPDTFKGENGALLRECRGLKFDSQGDILARPLEKFFNVGEGEDVSLDAIGDVTPRLTMMKRDGSMVHGAIAPDGEVVLMTRKGRTEIAMQAETLLTDSLKKYLRMLADSGMTAVFEYTAPNNRIVVEYETPALTLLAVRGKRSGRYTPHSDLQRHADLYGFSLVETVLPNRTIAEIVDIVRAWDIEEGVVCVLDDGRRVKVKADAYVMKHKAKDSLSNDKFVLETVLTNSEDDKIPLLDKETGKKLQRYAQDVAIALCFTADFIEHFVAKAREEVGDDARAFAQVYVLPNLPKSMQSTAFKVYRGAEALPHLEEYLLHKAKTRGPIEEEGEIIDNLLWSTYERVENNG